MQLLITTPLVIRNKATRKTYELLPVRMQNGSPSQTPDLWSKFLKIGGRNIQLEAGDADRIKVYMREHDTEALSDDGVIAFTLADGRLVECQPSVCGDYSLPVGLCL